MNCGCHDCNQSSSLGALMDLYGLGALLAAGSQVRVGFEIDRFSLYTEKAVIDALGGCLGNTGQFEWIEISINPTFYAHSYLQVNAQTARDFADVEDVGSLVAQMIQQCVPQIGISRRDAVAVDYVPSGAPAGAQQPRDAHGQTICAPGLVWQKGGWFSRGSCVKPSGSSTPQSAPDEDKPRPPGKCDAAWQLGISDYLACELGIDPNQAILVAGLGAVLALVVVMKIAR